jgi:hypothetical protein
LVASQAVLISAPHISLMLRPPRTFHPPKEGIHFGNYTPKLTKTRLWGSSSPLMDKLEIHAIAARLCCWVTKMRKIQYGGAVSAHGEADWIQIDPEIDFYAIWSSLTLCLWGGGKPLIPLPMPQRSRIADSTRVYKSGTISIT